MDQAAITFIGEFMLSTLGVEMHHLRPPYKEDDDIKNRISTILNTEFEERAILSVSEMEKLDGSSICFLKNSIELNYVLLKMPGVSEAELLVFGPFLLEEMNKKILSHVMAHNYFDQATAAALKTYYSTVPIVFESTMIAAAKAVLTFLYGEGTTSRIVRYSDSTAMKSNNESDEALNFSMRLLEKRYLNENNMMKAVARGDYEGASKMMEVSRMKSLGVRVGDSIRNAKNFLFVFSTICRKAAEAGGVHPVYIDRLSGTLAVEIENTNSISQLAQMRFEILRRYCQMVQSYSRAGYSQAIQNALNYIHLNLACELSLNTIAKELGFNATYLSAQFKKECKETITEYIHLQRVKMALKLLDETDLPVGEISAQVGMPDVSYFSRLFKKRYALSPLQYRTRQKDATPL